MATPSLAMIPSGYKDGTLYSPIPNTAAGDFSVSRGSLATRVNKEGLIETVAGDDTPRLDYTDGGCPVLLTEPQKTNYWEDSEGTSVTLNSPLGEFGFYTLNNSNQSKTITYVGTITFTFIVKKIDGTIPTITNEAGSGDLVVLVSGDSAAGVSGVLTSIGNGFYKYELTAVADGTSVARIENNSGVDTYVSLIQYEDGSYPTSYIPTSGGTATRLGDVVTGAGDSSTINSTEGVLFLEIAALADDGVNKRLTINEDSNNRIGIEFNTSGQIRFTVRIAGSFTVSAVFSADITENNKIAFKYKSGDSSFYLNGLNIGNATGAFAFAVGQLSKLDFSDGGSSKMYGKTSQVQVFNTVLSNAELIDLTRQEER